MALNIKDLNVFLDKKHILNNINLEIETGEFFSLLGPSGCGKTTLLKTIAGLLQPSSGSITLNDTPLDFCPPHRRGIVMVFQDGRLFPHLTVRENVAFSLKIAGINKKSRHCQAESMLDMVQLSGIGERRVSMLSGGQQQRVALARALICKPKILLLDEPFSGLDQELRLDMNNLVINLHQQLKITTLLVTHDREDARKFSNHIAVMSDGMLLPF